MPLELGQELLLIAPNLREDALKIIEAKIISLNDHSIVLDDGIEYAIAKKSPFKTAISLSRFGMTAYESLEDYKLQNLWIALCKQINYNQLSRSVPLAVRRELIRMHNPDAVFDEINPSRKIQKGDLLYFVGSNPEIGLKQTCMVTKSVMRSRVKHFETDLVRLLKPVEEHGTRIGVTDDKTPSPLAGSFYPSENSYQEEQDWMEFCKTYLTDSKATTLDKHTVIEILNKFKPYLKGGNEC